MNKITMNIFPSKSQKCYMDRESRVPWDIWGQKRSMTTKLGQKKKLLMQAWDNDDFHGVKGYQKSSAVNYELWLPNLVRKIPDRSLT